MKKTIQTEFNNSDTFIEFIKPKFKNVNFENSKIFNKLKTIFAQNQEAKATVTNLIKVVRVGLGFKAKSTLQIEFYLERGWSEEYGKQLISERQSKNSLKAAAKGAHKGRFTKKWYQERYPLDWEERYTEKHSKTSGLLDNFIRRYGEIEGQIKYDESNKKRAYSTSLAGRIEKYGVEEGTKIFEEYCQLRKYLMSEKSFIERYGREDGIKRWSNRNSVIGYKNSLEYYIEQYGEVQGREIIANLRRRSIGEFIKLYGDIEGRERWSNYITKLDGRSNSSYSKISQELFDSLGIAEAKYGKEERLFTLDVKASDKLHKNYIKPDFICGNKIIEFYGDLWHANPEIYESEDNHIGFYNKEKRAIDQWNEDAIRIKWLENEGFQVLIIWESDYIKNKNDTIQQCIEFIEN